jgi:DNA-binding transcriptional ArsR family regulator
MSLSKNDLLDDLWSTDDFPVLIAAVDLIDKSEYGSVFAGQIAQKTGKTQDEVVRALSRLNGEYLVCRDISADNIRNFLVVDSTTKAKVVTGVWPSPDRLIARLEDELEKEIEKVPEGSAKHMKLSALLDSLKNVATGVTTEVISQVLLRALGM